MLRGAEGELAHAARLGTPRGCTAGRGQGTGGGDKGQDPDRPAPSRSTCQESVGAAGEPEQPDLHKCSDLALLAPCSAIPAGEICPGAVALGTAKFTPMALPRGSAWPADPSLWWDTGTWPRSPQGQGWERNPGVLTRAVHLLPATLWDTGTRRPHGQLGGRPPPATPSSGTGDGTGHSTLPRAGRGCPLLCPQSGGWGLRASRTLVLLRTSPTKVETSRDPGMEARGRRSL